MTLTLQAKIEGYKVGRTKVFLRYFHADELNGKLEPFTSAANILSRLCRGYNARSKYSELLKVKREQDKQVHDFCNVVERKINGL